MKQIDKEKFQKKLERVRLQFSMTYFGKSNNWNLACRINDKLQTMERMTDEDHLLLWQLLNSALGVQTKEMLKRDLLPDELAKMYRDAGQVKSENSD